MDRKEYLHKKDVIMYGAWGAICGIIEATTPEDQKGIVYFLLNETHKRVKAELAQLEHTYNMSLTSPDDEIITPKKGS